MSRTLAPFVIKVVDHALGMPGRGTPRHTIRIPDPIWDRFGEAAGDRAAILRQLVLWYLGEGELPVRPVDVERERPKD